MSKRKTKAPEVNRTKLVVINCDTLDVQGFVGKAPAQKAKIDIDDSTQAAELIAEINGFREGLDDALAAKEAEEKKMKETTAKVMTATAEYDKWFDLFHKQ